MGERTETPLTAMQPEMAGVAECDAVVYDEAQLWVVGEAENVMSVQIPTASISAMPTCEPVPDEHVESPALVVGREPLTTSLNQTPVLVGMAVLTTWSPFPSALADECTGLRGMPFAKAVARTRFGRCTHLRPRLLTHLRALGDHGSTVSKGCY